MPEQARSSNRTRSSARRRKIGAASRPRLYPGRLIIVEGCDGSGKSTQIHLVHRWLQEQGYGVFFSEWNSSEIIKPFTKKAKKSHTLSPITFSLIHASDFADRYERMIWPLLRAGYIVLCDRYMYTAFARDVVRGCDPSWVRNLYRFAVKPDLALYFHAPLRVMTERVLSRTPELKYHEAGMDLGLSTDPVESFKLFQGMIQQQYDLFAEQGELRVIDATRTIPEQQQEVRALVRSVLQGYVRPGLCSDPRPTLIAAAEESLS